VAHEAYGVEIVMEMTGEDMAAFRDLAHFQTGLGSEKSDRWSVHGQTDNPDKGRSSWKKLPFFDHSLTMMSGSVLRGTGRIGKSGGEEGGVASLLAVLVVLFHAGCTALARRGTRS